eukprot:TRINITY_DN12758_c0_g1_i1.p1 TRINITY_DN12758_c0_g1~~TRINITY_DN12758_c0_g1_i1.p1  ORF type:complete len:275 (-),score=21.19 TRINITY_DN12758_c0_g1_i1:21-845(-)
MANRQAHETYLKKHGKGPLELQMPQIIRSNVNPLECIVCDADFTKHGAKRHRCSGCHSMYYCTLECQKKDWPTHKTECKAQQDALLNYARLLFPSRNLSSMAKLVNDETAMSTIGLTYLGGQKQPGLALFWIERAAKKGSRVSQMQLGAMYRDGTGVAVDIEKSTAWTKIAAEGGDLISQLALGNHYRMGMGVDKDMKEAARWYQAAAGNGSQRGMHNLGACYMLGEGVEKDVAKGQAWILKANGGSTDPNHLNSGVEEAERDSILSQSGCFGL